MLRPLVLVLLLSGACTPGPEAEPVADAGAVGEDAATTEWRGAYEACGGEQACEPPLTCINPAAHGGATCTSVCDADGDCAGGLCAATEPPVCALDCAADAASCPDGTSCQDVGGRVLCLGPSVPERHCFKGGAKLDLLFMVDDSNSMAQEQANLTANFAGLIDALVDPPDLDGDGSRDWEPLFDLHVGVVSSDVGTGGYTIRTCDDPLDGDNGELLSQGNTRIEGCAEQYPAFLEGPRDGLADDFRCVATLGTNGCGFEQQLESARRALVERALDTNAGFLRPDTALAVVLVTDEDDCSAAGPGIFDPGNAGLGVMGLRCVQHPELLTPVSAFVDALVSLRLNPERLTIAAIAGVPPDLLAPYGGLLTTADFDAILAAPSMQFSLEGERVLPSCDVAGLGEAIPPRRIVQLLRDLTVRAPGSAYLGSLCAADWTETIEGLAASIGRSLCAPIE